MRCTKRYLSVKLSTQKADGARQKDPCATVNPSSFMCAHTTITVLSYYSKAGVFFFFFFFSWAGPSHSVHKIIGCSLNEQRDIPVYSAIHQMATDFPAMSYLTPALGLQISSWVYHHCMDTGKITSKIFISTTSLWKKERRTILISHLGNWGVKTVSLGWFIQFKP